MDKVKRYFHSLAELGLYMYSKFVLLDVPPHVKNLFRCYRTVEVDTYEDAIKEHKRNGYYVVLVAPSIYNRGEMPFIPVEKLTTGASADIIDIIEHRGGTLCQKKSVGKENAGQKSI